MCYDVCSTACFPPFGTAFRGGQKCLYGTWYYNNAWLYRGNKYLLYPWRLLLRSEIQRAFFLDLRTDNTQSACGCSAFPTSARKGALLFNSYPALCISFLKGRITNAYVACGAVCTGNGITHTQCTGCNQPCVNGAINHASCSACGAVCSGNGINHAEHPSENTPPADNTPTDDTPAPEAPAEDTVQAEGEKSPATGDFEAGVWLAVLLAAALFATLRSLRKLSA